MTFEIVVRLNGLMLEQTKSSVPEGCLNMFVFDAGSRTEFGTDRKKISIGLKEQIIIFTGITPLRGEVSVADFEYETPDQKNATETYMVKATHKRIIKNRDAPLLYSFALPVRLMFDSQKKLSKILVYDFIPIENFLRGDCYSGYGPGLPAKIDKKIRDNIMHNQTVWAQDVALDVLLYHGLLKCDLRHAYVSGAQETQYLSLHGGFHANPVLLQHKRYFFFVVNKGNAHWMTYALDKKRGIMYVMDSMKPDMEFNRQTIETIINKLKGLQLLDNDFQYSIVVLRMNKQEEDSVSCGYFAVAYVIYLAFNAQRRQAFFDHEVKSEEVYFRNIDLKFIVNDYKKYLILITSTVYDEERAIN